MLPFSNKARLEEDKHQHKKQMDMLKLGAEERRKDELHGYKMGTASVGGKHQQDKHQQAMRMAEDKHRQGMMAADEMHQQKKKHKEQGHRMGMAAKADKSMVPPMPQGFAEGSIHIKPENEGKFTAKANAAGSSVQAYARKVLAAPEGEYDAATRKQANFARNAAGWEMGTRSIPPLPSSVYNVGNATGGHQEYAGYEMGKMMVPRPTNPEAGPSDTVPAMLTPGEAVIPREAAQNPQFKPLIAQMINHGRQVQHMNEGGEVPPMHMMPDGTMMAGAVHKYGVGTWGVPGYQAGTPGETEEERLAREAAAAAQAAPPAPAPAPAPAPGWFARNFGTQAQREAAAAVPPPRPMSEDEITVAQMGTAAGQINAAQNPVDQPLPPPPPKPIEADRGGPRLEKDTSTAPLTDRLNNAGAMIYYPGAEKLPGYAGTYTTGDGRTFIQFDNKDAGFNAAVGQIEKYQTGNSPAYKGKHGDAPLTVERLIETWAPTGKENSKASTDNYKAHVAKALGIGVNDTIPNTPEARATAARAIKEFERGTTGGALRTPSPAQRPAVPQPGVQTVQETPEGSYETTSGPPPKLEADPLAPPPVGGVATSAAPAAKEPPSRAQRLVDAYKELKALMKDEDVKAVKNPEKPEGWLGVIQSLGASVGLNPQEMTKIAVLAAGSKVLGYSNKAAFQHAFKNVSHEAQARVKQEHADKKAADAAAKAEDKQLRLMAHQQVQAEEKEEAAAREANRKKLAAQLEKDDKADLERAKATYGDYKGSQRDALVQEEVARLRLERQYNTNVLPKVREAAIAQAKKNMPDASINEQEAYAARLMAAHRAQNVPQQADTAVIATGEAVPRLELEHPTISQLNGFVTGYKTPEGVVYHVPQRMANGTWRKVAMKENDARNYLSSLGVEPATEKPMSSAERRDEERKTEKAIADTIQAAKNNAKDANGGQMPKDLALLNPETAAQSIFTNLRNMGMTSREATRQGEALAKVAGNIMAQEQAATGKSNTLFNDPSPFIKKALFTQYTGIDMQNDPAFRIGKGPDSKPMEAKHVATLHDALVQKAKADYARGNNGALPNQIDLATQMKRTMAEARKGFEAAGGRFKHADGEGVTGEYLYILRQLGGGK